MPRPRSALSLARSALFPALAVLVVANFAGYAIVGSNGLLAWGDYKRQLKERRAELALLQSERDHLARRTALVDPRRVDPDMADEMVRRQLGLVRPDEVILETGDEDPATH
ncbi:FtsB family cell division protein [Sphingomonas sp. ID0503]|uniref:FtsB family cell division protein n=1 Tax=Sphingomonas sp. ID0503 TaxID=3399691 RepID=UPI003AFA596C